MTRRLGPWIRPEQVAALALGIAFQRLDRVVRAAAMQAITTAEQEVEGYMSTILSKERPDKDADVRLPQTCFSIWTGRPSACTL